jgi:hypothetical protein
MFGRILAVGASAVAVTLHSSLHRKVDKMTELQAAHIAALTEQTARLETVELATRVAAKETRTLMLGLTAVGSILGAAIALSIGRAGGGGSFPTSF